jgi:hypothetical protein
LNQASSESHAQGWITFVGVLFGTIGALNAIDGLVALAGDKHFDKTELFTGNLTLWGVLLLVTAALQLLASVLIFKRNANGQGLGVILCVFNILTHMAFVSVYPIWSLLIIAIDVLIIYGLCVNDRYFK